MSQTDPDSALKVLKIFNAASSGLKQKAFNYILITEKDDNFRTSFT